MPHIIIIIIIIKLPNQAIASVPHIACHNITQEPLHLPMHKLVLVCLLACAFLAANILIKLRNMKHDTCSVDQAAACRVHCSCMMQ
jgi:hypothetical protein